jgi:hypothetical protein
MDGLFTRRFPAVCGLDPDFINLVGRMVSVINFKIRWLSFTRSPVCFESKFNEQLRDNSARVMCNIGGIRL